MNCPFLQYLLAVFFDGVVHARLPAPVCSLSAGVTVPFTWRGWKDCPSGDRGVVLSVLLLPSSPVVWLIVPGTGSEGNSLWALGIRKSVLDVHTTSEWWWCGNAEYRSLVLAVLETWCDGSVDSVISGNVFCGFLVYIFNNIDCRLVIGSDFCIAMLHQYLGHLSNLFPSNQCIGVFLI